MNVVERSSLIIADDHPLFRAGVKRLIEKVPHLELLAEAGDGQTALRLIEEMRPHVAILDIQMPGINGLNVTRRLKSKTETRIILLTMYNDEAMFLQAMEYGAAGYVLKDAAETEIVNAVTAVLNDKYYLSPELGGLLLPAKNRSGSKPASIISTLTPMELKVLALIATLKTNQEIADILFISKRTVENHRVNIAGKLNVSGTNSLLKFAIQNKALLPEI